MAQEKRSPIQIPAERRKDMAKAKEIREIISRAESKKQIFTIFGGPHALSDVREELLERGWVER